MDLRLVLVDSNAGLQDTCRPDHHIYSLCPPSQDPAPGPLLIPQRGSGCSRGSWTREEGFTLDSG